MIEYNRPPPAFLRPLRWLAHGDTVLLAALVTSSVSGRDGLVSVLGPIHGAAFLVLVGMVVVGATHRLWGWWYVALTVLLAGGIGASIGEQRLRAAARTREPL